MKYLTNFILEPQNKNDSWLQILMNFFSTKAKHYHFIQYSLGN